MGQKVNPIGLRIALTKNWESKWFARKPAFGEWLHEDLKIREKIKKEFFQASIARVQIERSPNRLRVTIYSARPGVLVGKKGAEIERIKEMASKLLKNKEVIVDVVEVKRPETNAQLVAEGIAMQLERRIGFRRAMKRAIQSAMEMGAEGIKIRVAGRLGGAELARVEQYKEGRTPLHTLRANIDYGFTEANTTVGKIGIKVWVCHKEGQEDNHAIDAKKNKVSKASARK